MGSSACQTTIRKMRSINNSSVSNGEISSKFELGTRHNNAHQALIREPHCAWHISAISRSRIAIREEKQELRPPSAGFVVLCMPSWHNNGKKSMLCADGRMKRVCSHSAPNAQCVTAGCVRMRRGGRPNIRRLTLQKLLSLAKRKGLAASCW